MIEQHDGHHDEARRLLAHSVGISESLGNQKGKAESLMVLGQLEAASGKMQVGLLMIREAVEILRKLGAGELPAAEQILGRVEAMAKEDPNRAENNALQAELHKAQVALQAGESRAAEAAAEAARHLAEKVGDKTVEAAAYFLMGTARLQAGQGPSAIEPLEAAEVILKDTGDEKALKAVRQKLTMARAQSQRGAGASLVEAELKPAVMAMKEGRLEEARALALEARGTLKGGEAAMAAAVETQALVKLERWEEALAAADAAVELAAAAGDRNLANNFRALQDDVRKRHAQKNMAKLSLETVRASADTAAVRVSRLILKALAELQSGHSDTAFVAFSAAWEEAKASGDAKAKLEVRVRRSLAYASTGEHEAAQVDLQAARDLARGLDTEAKVAVEKVAEILAEAATAPPS